MSTSTCIVRIHVPVDISGNFKRLGTYTDEECCGHYDLQLCKIQNIGTPTNYLTYSYPILSYGHMKQSEVAFFEEGRETSVYGSRRVRRYHWSFTANDDDIRNLLLALGGYLDGNNPKHESDFTGKLVRYNVTRAPYKDYRMQSVNCFKAVAQWTNSLGKPQLQSIYDAAHASGESYPARNYYAYRLADQLAASYWQDMGIKVY